MSTACPNIISREEWGARDPAKALEDMQGPAQYVFIHHGAGVSCTDKQDCIQQVQGYQNYHMDDHKWLDIGYNFVVGEDGNVYEARGWTAVGAHTQKYNHVGIGICVIGDFNRRLPNEAAQDTFRQLIQYGVEQGHISPGYTLKGHRDVGSTECPGNQLYKLIQSWPHYKSGTQRYA
ncbi:hypothetical protein V1264_000659 [Littorina saxatilis]|uniref:Peptidoglycan-recognition protein n=1 Tax=Littorina saxatilis TaxID=31220 RepID=A0AAN9BXP7_9CAEN